MSIKVQLATFTKRENSTAQFSGTWTDFDCFLKDGCSIITPRIELHTTTNLNAYNYAYIADFNRYYFIFNIEYYRDVVVLHLRCDTLATYKSDIGSSTEYVLRSASNYDGDIVDNLYPLKAQTTLSLTGQSELFRVNGTTPKTYVIGILNNTTTDKFGAVKYYVMTASEIGNLMNFLLGSDIILDSEQVLDDIDNAVSGWVTELQNGLIRALSNPTQYIIESYALPYEFPAGMLGTSETIKIGWWVTTITAKPIKFTSEFILRSDGILALGDHPQKASRGGYLNTEPFTRYYIDFGVFGQVPIDTMRVLGNTQIVYTIYADIFGNVRLDYGVAGGHLGTLSACVKCNFPMGQIAVDALGGAQAMLSSIVPLSSDSATVQTGNLITGASGILSAAQSLLPDARTNGTAGTLIHCYRNACLYTETHIVVDDDNTHRGRPYCRDVQISTLSGYILVSDADVSIPGTKEENQQIKNYMNNGFYYE